MDLNYHYCVTYSAARKAGFDLDDALIIAWSAWYVDKCKNVTVQSTERIFLDNLKDVYEEEAIHRAVQAVIWASFHFLPGDYEAIRNYQTAGHETDQKYHLICGPESFLVNTLVQAARDRYQTSGDGPDEKKKALMRIGIAMHTLADSYAHQSFAGISSKEINEVYHVKHRTTGHGSASQERFTKVWYVPLKEYSPAPTDKSFGYLGHGRIGTCLDVPSEVLRYQSSWRAPRVSVITRDNPLEFCCAYFQMIDAMRYIRSNDSEGLSFSNRMDRFALADREGTGMDEEREVMDIFRQATDDKKLAQVWQEYAKPRGFWGGHRPYPPEDSKDPEAAKEFQARNRLFVGEAMEQTMLVLANCPSLVSYIENVLHVDFVPPPLGIQL